MLEHTLKKLSKCLQANEFAAVQDSVVAMLAHCVLEDVQNLPWSAISLSPATAACVLKVAEAELLIVQQELPCSAAMPVTDFVEQDRLTATVELYVMYAREVLKPTHLAEMLICADTFLV